MGTRIHVSGLSYFCTDDKLLQAFTPFGAVVLAQVVRDECGHSLGTGVVHMARSEDVERVFNEHKRFEVAGSRVDLWEPAEPEHPQGRRTVVYDLRGTQAAQTGQERGHEKSRKAIQRVAVPGLRHMVGYRSRRPVARGSGVRLPGAPGSGPGQMGPARERLKLACFVLEAETYRRSVSGSFDSCSSRSVIAVRSSASIDLFSSV